MDITQIKLDLDTLTLGELAAAEEASGQDGSRLLKTSAYRRMLAVFVFRLRSEGVAPSWSDLQSLRLLGGPSSSSDSVPANPGAKSQV